MPQCRSCGAPIMWKRHATTGRNAPLDVAPAFNGRIGVNGDNYALCNAALERVECGVHTHHYTNHFATCKFAHSHRKKP